MNNRLVIEGHLAAARRTGAVDVAGAGWKRVRVLTTAELLRQLARPPTPRPLPDQLALGLDDDGATP